ncbi:EpsG family protein [Shewanella algae]|uniref:EpsG family protein n=1 Tax=Shewanella algae TaxID=38313 RepID=UPI001AAE4762|nr:EpsG family protein [Shewanella algae]
MKIVDIIYYSFVTILILVISSISGLRVESGADYFNYLRIYEFIQENGYFITFEPLFYLIYKISPSYNIANFTIAILTNTITYVALIKLNGRNYAIYALWFFLITEVYLTQFNIVRQALALPFIFLFTFYLIEKRRTQAIFFIVLSTFSHYIGIVVCFLAALASRIKLNVVGYLIFGGGVYIAAQSNVFLFMFKFIASYMPQKFSGYMEMDFTEGRTLGLKFVVDFLMFIGLLYFFKPLRDEKIRVIVNIMFLGYMIAFAATTVPILFRLAYFFIFFKVIFFALLMNSRYVTIPLNKFFVFSILTVYNLIVLAINLSGNIYEIFPYRMVFF